MAGDLKLKFGSSGQTLMITLASLANNSARASAAVDNGSNLYSDVLVFLKLKSASSGTTSTGYVNVYAYGSVDGGTTYSEGLAGSDASATLTSPPNVRLIGVVSMVAVSTTYYSALMSVASAFGGVMPDRWGIIVENKSGGAFDSTEGNHAKLYQGVYGQYT
jgi:hypothetical protein